MELLNYLYKKKCNLKKKQWKEIDVYGGELKDQFLVDWND